MVELPQGVVIEVRRGGHDALRQLAGDMARLEISGHIRIERKPKELMPRVSQIVIHEGTPKVAIHESDGIKMGLEALLEIESDATALDALISLHELSDEELEQIIHLYPDAHMFAENQDSEEKGEQWWNQVNLQSRRWVRDNRLPEIEATVETSEFIRQKTKAQLKRLEGQSRTLNLGDALIFDAEDSQLIVELSSALAGHGRPIQVISRTHPTSLNREHDIPINSCLWLSSKEEEGSVSPDLDLLRKKVLNFLWANKQAIVAIDGLEYLSTKNDDTSVMEFVRTIVDEVRMEDHVLLLSCDFSAFSATTRHHLTREVEELQPHIIELWLMEAESLFEHPICIEVSEEESKWIEQQLGLLSSRAGDMIESGNGEFTGGSVIIETEDAVSAGENLAQVVEQWSEEEQVPGKIPSPNPRVIEVEEISEHEESESEVLVVQNQSFDEEVESRVKIHSDEPLVSTKTSPIPLIKKPSGPRKAIRMKRRRVKSRAPTQTTIQLSKSSISAAAQNITEIEEIENVTSYSTKKMGIAENLEDYTDRQKSAFEKTFNAKEHSQDGSLLQASKQKAARKISSLPKDSREKTIQEYNQRHGENLKTNLNPLMARGIEVETKKSKFARESASRKQINTTIEQHYDEWNKANHQLKQSSVSLFDDAGKELKRVRGDKK